MDNTEGIAPEGAVTQTEGVEGQPTPPETQTVDRVKELEQQLEQTRRSQAGSDRMVAKLKEEKEAALAELATLRDDSLDKKLGILAKAQAGTLDESQGSVDQQIARIDAEHAQKRQSLVVKSQYEQHVKESLATVKDILADAGLNPDSDTPEVKEVQKAWSEAVEKGTRLDSVIAKATKVAMAKVKSSQPSEEQVKQKVLEDFKKSSAVKVETGGPSAQSSSRTEILRKYSEGDKSVTRKMYEEAIGKK